jgi:hypothetical protein
VQFFKSPYQVLRNWFSSRPKNGGSR